MGLRAWLSARPQAPTIRVQMTHSVADFVAGEAYDLPVELADDWLIKGYCTGKTSREFTDEEVHAVKYLSQSVGI
jgi:hypothetical protein